ncbi:MAG: hypothetical protein EBS37_17420 [Betaproteobacteria bacterium]|nr:hypothetical protein [Betaproteobacteria bacterium]
MPTNFDESAFDATRRKLLKVLSASPLVGMSSLALAQQFPTAKVNTTGLAVTDTEVTVGQLHSATGTMAISETGSIQAEQLAIDQINAMGGILGRKIKVIKEDGASDWPTFAEKAKKLLVNDRVASVYGCWTSASRKAVLPIFEKENGLLYYPTFYEGLEQSKNVFYTGQEATQQILFGLDWAKMTDAQRPAVNLPRAPFSREAWTHAVFTLEYLNDKAKKPVGRLFLNGKLMGSIENWDLTLGWNPDAVQLVLGASYVGYMDDLAVFNRALTSAEVTQLFGLKTGVRELHP